MKNTQKKLFGLTDVKNKTSRSGFDLSKRLLYTAKVGELLPVYHKRVMPGDHFKFSLRDFTRTQPVESSAFTRLRGYYDFFYIPYRLLWRNAPSSFTQMTKAPTVASGLLTSLSINDKVPYIKLEKLVDSVLTLTANNIVGLKSSTQAFRLLTMLGYGSFEFVKDTTTKEEIANKVDLSQNVTLFPLLAYQKVYYDFYRNSQWETNRPQAYNVDYFTGSTDLGSYGNIHDIAKSGMFELRFANFAKDLFFGLLPNAQNGDTALVDVGISGNISLPHHLDASGTVVFQPNGESFQSITTEQTITDTTGVKLYPFASRTQQGLKVGVNGLDVGDVTLDSSTLEGALNVLSLRNGLALQKWKEVAQSGNTDYRSQIEKHFNVKLPHSLTTLCTYIGGLQSDIVINEVVNNNLTAENQAEIKGKGLGSADGSFEFDVKEHGIIVGVYHCCPQVDYHITGHSRDLTAVNISDYAIPEFDRLGFEPVSFTEFFNAKDFNNFVPNRNLIGYAPRYYSYKTDIDEVKGAFVSTLPNWVAQFDSDYFKQYFDSVNVYSSFKINPAILNDIFGVVVDSSFDTDQLLIGLNLDIKAVRNLDYTGLPY